MRILLVNPSQENVYGMKMVPAYPPLGILYIGTVLKNEGHVIRLLDIDTENIDENKFNKIFREFDPDAVGISCVTPTFRDAHRWARLSKKNKDIPIVLGGIHPTIVPGEVIKDEYVDIVVVGEGELTAVELFNSLSETKSDLKDVKGIYFKQGNNIVTTPRRPLIDDLDTLPFPDRTLLQNPHGFMPPDAFSLPVATIMTSRGCPGDCIFCCTKQIFAKRFRARSVTNIIEEIKHLVDKENIREIHIADDTFTINKKRVLDFCHKLKEEKINVDFQFMNGLRADFVDIDILTALKDAGINTVGYGVESGSEAILKNAKKNIPLDVTRKTFKLSKELGFETWAFLILGLPGETEETIKETIRFTKELDPDFAKFFILKPYPGSEVHAEFERRNLLLKKDYNDYGLYLEPVHKLPGLDPDRMVYWQRRAFREFYLRPGKIIAHLKRLINSRRKLKLIINDIKFAIYCMFRGSRG